MLRALLLALVFAAGVARAATDPEGHELCTAPPPPGTGLRADGRGFIHFMRGGTFTFPGVKVDNIEGPHYFAAASWASVGPHQGKLEWIRPDGVREVVPTEYLYPPMGLVGEPRR